MIILDTDHISALQARTTSAAFTLQARLDALITDEIATTTITVEEQMRGWMALIRRHSDVHQQVAPYDRLIKLFDFYAQWQVLPFDPAAADTFTRLRSQGVRIGTMDLKIAAIVLVTQGTLLSCNNRDFLHVPGIRVENWLQS